MFNQISPIVVLGLLGLGCFCFFRTMSNWTSGLKLLTAVLFFGGIISVQVANGSAAIVFRDAFIVLPLYLSLFASRVGAAAMGRLPADFALGLVLLSGYVFLSIFNPVGAPPLQLLIGLKVWLFYIPFVIVGMAIASDSKTLFSALRTVLYLGMVPCAIGLVQYLFVHLFGYQTAIGMFFGNAAQDATQQFTSFEAAGGIYRIPSTFSFVSQYSAFVCFYFTVAVIEANADPDPKVRSLAQLCIVLALMAGLLSGSRSAPVVFPLFLIAFACFGLLKSRIIIALPIAAGVAVVSSLFSGLQLGAFFSFGTDLAVSYGTDYMFPEVVRSLAYGPFGAGIGMATGAARYALPGAEGATLGFEVYFGKVSAELGFVGLFIFAAFFLSIGIRSVSIALRNRWNESNVVVAPMAIYVCYNLVMCLKGSVLDTDPGDIFFWLALGITIEIDRRSRRTVPTPARLSPIRSGHVAIDRGKY